MLLLIRTPAKFQISKRRIIIIVDGVVINTHNTIYTNGHINVTKIIKLVNFSGNNYFTKKIKHTSNITNSITRHKHNNYEHNVIIIVNKHMNHINKYDTEIHYYNNQSFDEHKYDKCYNDALNVRNNEIISNSQQTDITNNIIETNTQTTE